MNMDINFTGMITMKVYRIKEDFKEYINWLMNIQRNYYDDNR